MADRPQDNGPGDGQNQVRDPAGIVASATLPAIPLGVLAAVAGKWLLDMPLLVWGGLVLAAGNLVVLAGFVFWYRGRQRRRQRAWQERAWEEGLDDE